MTHQFALSEQTSVSSSVLMPSVNLVYGGIPVPDSEEVIMFGRGFLARVHPELTTRSGGPLQQYYRGPAYSGVTFYAAAILPHEDGYRLVAASSTRSAIKVSMFDVLTGEELMSRELGDSDRNVHLVSRGGVLVAVLKGHQILFLDPETLRTTQKQIDLPVQIKGIDVSPSGSRVAAACEDGTVRVLGTDEVGTDEEQQQQQLRLPNPKLHSVPAVAVSFSPDERSIAAVFGVVHLAIFATAGGLLSSDSHYGLHCQGCSISSVRWLSAQHLAVAGGGYCSTIHAPSTRAIMCVECSGDMLSAPVVTNTKRGITTFVAHRLGQTRLAVFTASENPIDQ